MGADIYGWIEVRDNDRWNPDVDRWQAVIELPRLVDRNYEVFAALFDVRNGAQVAAPYAHRGMPGNASGEVRALVEKNGDLHDVSWMIWSELKMIDWEDIADREWKYRLEWLREERGMANPRNALEQALIQRTEALSPGWSLLFQVMTVLATHYGEEGVRLVAGISG